MACVELSAFLDGALSLLYAPLDDCSPSGSTAKEGGTLAPPRLCDVCGLGEAEGLEAAVAAGAVAILRAFTQGPPASVTSFKDEVEDTAEEAAAKASLKDEVRDILSGCTTIEAADYM